MRQVNDPNVQRSAPSEVENILGAYTWIQT